MPPRTRKVCQARTPNQALNRSNNASLEESTHASIVDQVHVEAQVIINPTHPQNNPNRKRTFPTHEDSPATSTTFSDSLTPVKRARPKPRVATVEKASFYPGLNGIDSILDVENDNLADTIPDEAHFEREDDWIEAPSTAEVSQGQPSKFSKSLATERPTWTSSRPMSGPQELTSTTPGGGKGPRCADTSLAQGTARAPTVSRSRQPPATEAAMPAQASAVLPPTIREAPVAETLRSRPWPTETDLHFIPGSTRITLTGQQPTVRMVIGDAIDNVRVSLVFIDAFPDAACMTEFVREGLLSAAARRGPATAAVLKRLQEDEEYFSTISPLARISIFRAKVKECVNAITSGTFQSMSSPMKVAESVVYQLSNYNYTFPPGPARSTGSLVMRSRPYRNDRIINAIRDLYFSGGHMSFASRCSSHFPSCDHCDNVTRREVPVPMVALVATALYAVIFEWRSGKQDVEDFSANSYLDVYLGHIETLREILTQRSGAFHSMMADIYSKASTMPASTGSSSGVQTAELNFEELED
ncbi:hypothetical protein V8E53_012645 [Lactarius tabidus]